MRLRLCGKKQERHWMLVFAAMCILVTLIILHSFNSNIGAVNPLFHVATNRTFKSLDLKKWSGRDSYVPVYGSKKITLNCHYCALVTSSSHILGTEAGGEIDRTECVIRMNDAPTLGYESDVGKRTTLRVIGHTSVPLVVKRPNGVLQSTDSNPVIIIWGPPNKIRKDPGNAFYKLLQKVSMAHRDFSYFTVTPDKMLKFDSLFHTETGRDREESHSWLSTGWFTMVIAIEMCDNIKVYGMVPPNHCRTPGSKRMPYHYYKPRVFYECVKFIQDERGNESQGQHRFITEKHVFARWAKQYNISFTHPKW